MSQNSLKQGLWPFKRSCHVEKCALQHSSSLWEWVEEALDSRTRPWLGVPPFIRADDSTAPISMLSGSNPSLSLVGIDPSVACPSSSVIQCTHQMAISCSHICPLTGMWGPVRTRAAFFHLWVPSYRILWRGTSRSLNTCLMNELLAG